MKEFFKKILKFFINRHEQLTTAGTMYLIAKYNRVQSLDKRKDYFLIDILNTIRFKAENGEFNCTKDIPDELLNYKDEFIETLRSKGYKVKCLDVLDKELSKTLFIYWSGFKF